MIKFKYLIIFFALSLTGCGTIMHGTTQNITIQSSVDNAKVVVYDKDNKIVYEGNAPATVKLKRGVWFRSAKYRVEVSRDGYETQTVNISPKYNWKYSLFGNILYGGGMFAAGIIGGGIGGGIYGAIWGGGIINNITIGAESVAGIAGIIGVTAGLAGITIDQIEGGAWTLKPEAINTKHRSRGGPPRQDVFKSGKLSESNLAILPFTGGGTLGEREKMTNLCSTLPQVRQTFGRVFITSSIGEVERGPFKSSTGLTDSDRIAGLGKVHYVIAGHIYDDRGSKILLLTVIHAESRQLIAGGYGRLEDAKDIMDNVVNNIKTNVQKYNGKKRSKLSVLPFFAHESDNQSKADVLTQILTIKLANDGNYAVLPLNGRIQKAMTKYKIGHSELHKHRRMKQIGDYYPDLWLQYVVSGEVSQQEGGIGVTVRRFNAQSGRLVTPDLTKKYNVAIDWFTIPKP